eukprot:646529-Amphidinium_carterae.1
MLSGRSTVVAATPFDFLTYVLAKSRRRLNFAADGRTMEVWHGSDRLQHGRVVQDWPGIQRKGAISEYQLVVVR